jgi:hypothetical protein
MTLTTIFLSYYDLLVTPLYLAVFTIAMVIVSAKIANREVRRYFFWGIMLKVVFAILFGVIYEFFYYGGDTSAYWLYGTYIGDALWDSPVKWLKLIGHADLDPSIYEYAMKIRWYESDDGSYFPCRIVGILAPFCMNTYSVIAIFYAAINFSGLWALFRTLHKAYPTYQRQLAISVFFIPSILFWGAGIMKDGLTLSALGWLFFGFHNFFILREFKISNFIIIIIAAWVISIVKIYVLLCFIPSASIWLFLLYEKRIKNKTVRILLKPVILPGAIALGITITYYAASSSKHYSFDNIGRTAQVTRDYLLSMSNRGGGSGYDLGELDQSALGLIKQIPAAINVSLFRPYIWESKNFFMLMSALESLYMLLLTIQIVLKLGFYTIFQEIRKDPFLAFCIIFTFTFAFAIGLSTNNFGTLTRYKIPLIPFFMMFLYILKAKIPLKKAMEKKRELAI